MKTLMMSSSSSPLLLRSSKNRAFSSSRSALLSTKNKPEFINFHQKRNYKNNVDISHSISMQFKAIIGSVSCKYSSSESSFFPQSEGNAGNTEIPSQETLQSKTAQVVFQLIKECSFSQELLIVGNDPIFGAWDISRAIPLKRSEGHFWTSAQLDLPIDKRIQFKYILKDSITGEVIWQPGPNRFCQTWETINEIIFITETWDFRYLERTTMEELVTKLQAEREIYG
ncbi:hypothetical protein MKX01_007131 [Papaver californicum]|nr:hypothetical protein MKX01_007131 [Papaver californicum]